MGLHLLTSWPLYVLLALGTAGFLLNQRAYHRAPLARSLPALNTVNPLVAAVFGFAAFGERPSGGTVTVIGEVIGVAAVLTGIFLLSRRSETVAQV